MPPLSRLQQLLQHLNPAAAPEEQGQLRSQECAARSHALPRFDVEYLAAYLDEYKDLKAEIYGKLESRQDLLVATVEGLTKGVLFESCPTRMHTNTANPPSLEGQVWPIPVLKCLCLRQRSTVSW